MNDAPRPSTGLPHPRRRMRSWTLALILSLVLVTGWATFLAVAPTPQMLPAAPAPVAATTTTEPVPTNQVRLLAWRNAIDADVLAGFAADTGLKVVVDGYDTAEQLETLAAGS